MMKLFNKFSLLHEEKAQIVILSMLLFYPVISDYVFQLFVLALPFFSASSIRFVLNIICWIAAIFYCRKLICRRFNATDILIFLVITAFMLLMNLILPNEYFTLSVLVTFLFMIFPYFFWGKSYTYSEKQNKVLYLLAFITLAVNSAYYFYYLSSGRVLHFDNMD